MKCDLYFMALRKSKPSELRRQEAYRPHSDCCPIAPSMGRAHGCHGRHRLSCLTALNYGLRRRTRFVLSRDQDLKRAKNDWPSNSCPSNGRTLALTFSMILSPTLNDLIV